MTRASLLLVCLWVAADITQDGKWLLRIWWVIGLAGASIAFLGLLQKATGAEMIFWQAPDDDNTKTFFSTYYYHGNAGAYLNLTFPLISGLAYRYMTRPRHHMTKAFWLTLLVIHVVAILSNTSRMSGLIGVSVALVLVTAAAALMIRRARDIHWPTVIVGLCVLSVALWAVTQPSRLDEPLKRWSETQLGSASGGRWEADVAASHSLARTGTLGFGPGTFSVVFPFFAGAIGDPTQIVWLFLHNDYLQTIMEWGWLGSLLWGTVFFGGTIVATRGLLNSGRYWLPRQRLLLSLVLVSLVGVGTHAAVDFPLQISSIQLYVAVYLGTCWGSEGWGGRRKD